MKHLIKEMLEEALFFEQLQSMMDEDYPSSFDMEHFKSLRGYSKRVKYCEEHLRRISSGSARIVYMVDNTKVLKLAKNEKGVAQCETEIHWGNDSYFGHILAHTLESHPDGLWVEMELARKVRPKDFLQIEGIDFDEFGRYVQNRFNEIQGRRSLYSIQPEVEETLQENDFANDVVEFANQTEAAGDLGRLNSYGLVKRDGQDTIVIIDFGLTGEIYSTYYDRRAA